MADGKSKSAPNNFHTHITRTKSMMFMGGGNAAVSIATIATHFIIFANQTVNDLSLSTFRYVTDARDHK